MREESNIKVKFLSLAIVVFLLGSITGAAMHALYQIRTGSGERITSAVLPLMNGIQPQPHPGMMMEIMRRELNLTDEQFAQIKGILEDSRKEFRKAIKEQCPAIKETRDKTDAKIREVLTPEQQQKFDELKKKREAMKDKDEK